jgi:hypothetical protein
MELSKLKDEDEMLESLRREIHSAVRPHDEIKK